MICLDSGCGNYDQLWGTTSLRGIVNGVAHRRGADARACTRGRRAASCPRASASRASSSRASRTSAPGARGRRTSTSTFRPRGPRRRGRSPACSAPTSRGASRSSRACATRRTIRWRCSSPGRGSPRSPSSGAAGLPAPADGGNVLRPQTSLKLSLRIPPTLDAARASRRLKEILEADPPYGARVRFKGSRPSPGWDAPATAAVAARRRARRLASATSGGPPCSTASAARSRSWPCWASASRSAQFFITGTGGPGSNAHGPERVPPRAVRRAPHRLRGRPDRRPPPRPPRLSAAAVASPALPVVPERPCSG